MSNGRINRTRASATRPENNKIYILICAEYPRDPRQKNPAAARLVVEEKEEEREKDEGPEVAVCHATKVQATREGYKV